MYEYCRKNGSPCCSGYKWDQDQAMCTRCNIGYVGIHCAIRCPFPYYGLDCQSKCNCSEKNCDNVNGCRHSTKEHPPSSSRYREFNFKAIITTQYTIGNHKKSFNVTVVKGCAKDLQIDLKTAERAPYEAKRLIYPTVGLSVTAFIITVIYIYTWRVEKHKLPTYSV
uniref:Uncharacterized protein n=1 Tax=Magallana gigas TaxID=29159 RepID=A0A8W8M7C9_MAGGI